MSPHHRFPSRVLAILCACGGPLLAAETATLPYRGFCESMGLTFQGDTARWPEELSLSVRSELPDVKPADIRLTLQAGDEAIPLAIGEDGRFILPLDRRWFEADAVLVTNQPPGTVAMSCEFNPKLTVDEVQFVAVSPHLEAGRIAYATLERLAHKSRRQMYERALEKQFGRDVAWRMKAAGKLDTLDEPVDKPLILLFVEQEGDAAEVTVAPAANPFRRAADRWAAGFGKKKADIVQRQAPGRFVIAGSKDLAATNPTLVLSDNPTWRCLLLDRDDVEEGQPPPRPADSAGAHSLGSGGTP